MKVTRKQLRRLISETAYLNEGIVLSSILSLPVIFNGLAKIMKNAGRRFNKEKLELKAENLEHFAHSLHNAYRKPIKFIIQKSTKKDISTQQLEKYTDVFFSIVLIFMLSKTGLSIYKEIKHLSHHFELATLTLTIVETVLGSIEAMEEVELISHLTNKETQLKIVKEIDKHIDVVNTH